MTGRSTPRPPLQQMRAIRAQIKPLLEKAGQAPVAKAIAAFDQKAGAIEGAAGGGMGQRGGGAPPAGGERGGAGAAGDTLSSIGSSLTSLMSMLQAADAAPTSQLAKAVAERRQALAALTAKWNAFKTADVAALNAQLKAASLPAIEFK